MRDKRYTVVRVVHEDRTWAKCSTHPKRELFQVLDHRAGPLNGERGCKACLIRKLGATIGIEKRPIVIYETRAEVWNHKVRVEDDGTQTPVF